MNRESTSAPPVVLERLRYEPALDGLRALAVLFVMAYHARVEGFDGGGTGVTVFFVLSGFLITTLLLQEQRDTGRVDLRAFWTRRALRLFPALFALLGVILVAGWTRTAQVAQLTTDHAVLPSLFFVSNWFRAFGETLWLLEHTWSLAVEEQFYVVWPLLLVAVASRSATTRDLARTMLAVSIAVVVGVFVWRLLLVAGGSPFERTYNGLDTRADGVAMGSVLAALLATLPHTRRLAVRRIATLLAGPAAAVLVVCSTVVDTEDRFFDWGGHTLVAGASAVLVAQVMAAEGRLAGVLGIPLLASIGRLSYALYLWHLPILIMLDIHTDWSRALQVTVGFATSFLAAGLSWFLVERPALRHKPARRTAPAPAVDRQPEPVARRPRSRARRPFEPAAA